MNTLGWKRCESDPRLIILCPIEEADPEITAQELKWLKETKERICAKIFNETFNKN